MTHWARDGDGPGRAAPLVGRFQGCVWRGEHGWQWQVGHPGDPHAAGSVGYDIDPGPLAAQQHAEQAAAELADRKLGIYRLNLDDPPGQRDILVMAIVNAGAGALTLVTAGGVPRAWVVPADVGDAAARARRDLDDQWAETCVTPAEGRPGGICGDSPAMHRRSDESRQRGELTACQRQSCACQQYRPRVSGASS